MAGFDLTIQKLQLHSDVDNFLPIKESFYSVFNYSPMPWPAGTPIFTVMMK
jgi:hypothetical protein